MKQRNIMPIIGVGLLTMASSFMNVVAQDEETFELSTTPDVTGVEGDASGGELISVSLNNTPIQEAIGMFARLSGANIVSDAELEGSVTVSLTDVEWEPGLKAILDIKGMTIVERSPGIFAVVSQSQVAREPLDIGNIFLRYSTTENVLPIVQSMLVSSNASVSAFTASNALIVKETPEQIKAIEAFVMEIDRPRPQVFVEVKFVELNDQAIQDLGINWEVLSGYTVGAGQLSRSIEITKRKVEQDATGSLAARNRTSNRSESTSDAYNSGSSSSGGSEGFENETTGARSREQLSSSGRGETLSEADIVVQGKNFTDISAEDGSLTSIPPYSSTEVLSAVLTAQDFSATLSALKQNDGVQIISDPKVMVGSGLTANIHVGRNEPNVIALPQGDTGDRFAYTLDPTTPFIEIGVRLSVTPTVNTASNITVKITPELSRKLADRVVGESGTTFPVTQVRKIETEFNLESGKTIAIGGLTTFEEVENVKKIPLLGDIPIIGKYLFTHRHTEEVQDEVIVFVTVTLAEPGNVMPNEGIPSEANLIYANMVTRKKRALARDRMRAAAEKEMAELEAKAEEEAEAELKAEEEEGEELPEELPTLFRETSTSLKTSEEAPTLVVPAAEIPTLGTPNEEEDQAQALPAFQVPVFEVEPELASELEVEPDAVPEIPVYEAVPSPLDSTVPPIVPADPNAVPGSTVTPELEEEMENAAVAIELPAVRIRPILPMASSMRVVDEDVEEELKMMQPIKLGAK